MNHRSSAWPNRRQFLAQAAASGVVAATPYVITSAALGGEDRPAASQRITMGCIGLGGRGTVNMETFLGQPEVQIVALCDVDAGSTRYEDAWHRGLVPAQEKVESRYAAQRTAGTHRGVSGSLAETVEPTADCGGDTVVQFVLSRLSLRSSP